MADGWFTLAGVALGAFVTWLLSWGQRRAAVRLDRERLILEIASEFVAACLGMWSAARGAVYAVSGLTNLEASRSTDPERLAWNLEVSKEYEQRRLDAFAESREHEPVANLCMSKMRILLPAIADPAQELMAASGTYDLRRNKELTDAQRDARLSFEQAVRNATPGLTGR